MSSSLRRWDRYTEAKEIMFQRTHRPEAPWWIVDGEDKYRARLNCIQHLLSQIPYRDLPRRSFAMPAPQSEPKSDRTCAPGAFYVPQIF